MPLALRLCARAHVAADSIPEFGLWHISTPTYTQLYYTLFTKFAVEALVSIIIYRSLALCSPSCKGIEDAPIVDPTNIVLHHASILRPEHQVCSEP